MNQEVKGHGTYQPVYQALQPANRCQVHTDLRHCGDPSAENYRIDSGTGQCMTKGWVFLGGLYYIADELRAEALCHSLWGSEIAQVYSDETDHIYYTEWGEL